MKRRLIWIICLGSLMTWTSCEEVNENYSSEAANPAFIHRSMDKLTDVIVHDIFSPPQASRIYAYPSVAAYEVLRHDFQDYQTLAGQLTDLQPTPTPEADQIHCFPLAAVHAFLTVGKALIFSEDMIETFEGTIYQEFQALKMPKAVYDRSIEYGQAVATHILDWVDQDNYKQTRTFPKYSITDDPAMWKPTPPDYMDGIEPHWNKIRPMVIQSADQFTPAPPTPFDMTEGSLFYQEVMEVYTALDEDKEERIDIAAFWDCNPYVSHHRGHVMFATKKITPGGHWIGIARIAAEKAESDIMETTLAYAKTSIALMDGFISCWDEKYRSNLIRPETVINEHIDDAWTPSLQTPPFPEYTSGHSVISRAAAVALTSIYGDNFSYVDSVEVKYGLKPRSYDSFLAASDEAAISRIYGGIHYRPACVEGVAQGEAVGQFIIDNLATKGQDKVGMQ